MNNNKVSVVMSVFNGESNVENTIQSVLNQSYENFEFIIVNDKSSDNTTQILERVAGKDRRVKILNNTSNLGLTKSLIKGINICAGEYIARIDSGDLMLKDRLTKQVNILENDSAKKFGVVATDCITSHIFNGNESISKSDLPDTDRKIRKKLIFKNCIAHVSVMFRKEVYLKVGGYDETLTTSQDFDLWIKILKISEIYSLKEYLTKVIYDDSIPSISLYRNKRQIRNGIKILSVGIREGTIPVISGGVSIISKIVKLYTPIKLLKSLRAKKRKVFSS